MSCQLNAQYPTFGSSKIEIASDIASTNDGFVLLGTAQNSGSNFDLWAVFTDTSGSFLAEKRYGGFQKDIAAQISPTTNGFFIFGTTYSSELTNYQGNGDFLLIKTNTSGEQIWQNLYGGTKLDLAKSVATTGDGGAVLAGMTHSNISGFQYGQGDLLIIKIDADGNTQWEKTFGGSKTDYPTDIQTTSDGGYIITGTTFSKDGNISSNIGHSDIWVLKLSHAGDVQWSQTFGSNTFDYGQAILQTNNGYILTGSIGSNKPNTSSISQRYDQDLAIIKINELGQIIWKKTYGQEQSDTGLDIFPLHDNIGYIIAGYSETSTSNLDPFGAYQNAWTLKIDSDGNKTWETFSSGSFSESSVAICANAAKNIIAVTGTSDSKDGEFITTGNEDIWFQKHNDQSSFSVSLGNDFGICMGKQINLDATIPGCSNCSYLWDNGANQAVQSITPTATQTYTVTVTSGTQTTTDNITISVFPNPTVGISQHDSDAGQSNGYIIVTPQGGTPNYQIIWDHGSTDFLINQLSGGDYHFLLTDHNGCSVNETIHLDDIVGTQAISASSLNIFPNPIGANSTLHLQTSQQIKNIKIFTESGNLLLSTQPKQLDFQLNDLPVGTYSLHIIFQNEQRITKKLQIY